LCESRLLASPPHVCSDYRPPIQHPRKERHREYIL
jgi:hypothetical protein